MSQRADDVTISITVDARTAAYLRALTRSSSVPEGTLEDVVAYLVHSAADGLRRPGAWERGWLEQAFGDFPEGMQTEGVHYSHLEPWEPLRIDQLEVFETCAKCGCDAEVHVTQWCAWECLGCLIAERDAGAGLGSSHPAHEIPAEDLAVASLLAFAARCFEREDRNRDAGEGEP